MQPWMIWLITGGALLTLEIMTPGLVFLFFGVGALLVGLLLLLVPLSPPWQIVLFTLFSLLSLLLARRWLRRIFTGKRSAVADGLDDDSIGKQASVVAAIRGAVPGKVEFQGTAWEAVADEELPVGTPVEIVSRSNLTFTVRRLSR